MLSGRCRASLLLPLTRKLTAEPTASPLRIGGNFKVTICNDLIVGRTSLPAVPTTDSKSGNIISFHNCDSLFVRELHQLDRQFGSGELLMRYEYSSCNIAQSAGGDRSPTSFRSRGSHLPRVAPNILSP